VDRRRFLTRGGLALGGGAVGAAGATGAEEYRIQTDVAAAGRAVGAHRPPGVAATTITYRARVRDPLIALTFDDGPSARYTPRVLDILDEKNVPATFFLIGRHVVRYPDLARRIAARHETGNHTWSHPNLSFAAAPSATAELARAASAISTITGRIPTVFRPPYGAFSGATAMVATGLGYPIVLWDFEFDQHGESAATNLDRMVRATRSGSIVLGHDGGTLNCSVVVEVLPALIDRVRDRGFVFVTVSALLRAAAVEDGADPSRASRPAPAAGAADPGG
jgi:peptidoglycan-N-acetylglucosamine deacetylase